MTAFDELERGDKTYHEESLMLQDTHYDGEPLGEGSHVLPWSLATLNYVLRSRNQVATC